jgi:nucleotide-binding universal stress UspA family protein
MLPVATILHPTDFSKEADYAFDMAWWMAHELGAWLVVLHVEPPPAALGHMANQAPLTDDFEREEAEQALRRRIPLPGIGVLVDHRVERGEPARVILQVAQEIGADLIVMGTHGRTGFRRLLMDSVAEEVARLAPCPVLTVKAPLGAESEIAPPEQELAAMI